MDRIKKQKTVSDTVCKVHKSGRYAVLSNCFVRSTNIGCDSIGLLGKVMDLPPTWNFTIAGLAAICDDGETAIKLQLAELEAFGYVKKTMLMPNESSTGRIGYVYIRPSTVYMSSLMLAEQTAEGLPRTSEMSEKQEQAEHRSLHIT